MDGARPSVGQRTLDGWQEIADYLGKAVRTAQRWERDHGLPVRRLAVGGEEAQKGIMVHAFADELDAWLAMGGTDGDEHARDGATVPAPHRSPMHASLVARVGVLVAMLAASSIWWPTAIDSGGPLHLTMENAQTLAAHNATGTVVWRRSLALPMRYSFEDPRTHVDTLDLDGDGTDEFLLMVQPLPDRGEPDYLLAIDAQGNELWRFEPSRAVTIDGVNYDANFTLTDFAVVHTPQPYIVVTANHRLYLPAIVSVLDTHGEERSRYLHTGWIFDLLPTRLSGVEGEVIVFGGTNNLLETAVVGVLPVGGTYVGTSPGPVSPDGLVSKSVELAYLALPRTELSKQLHSILVCACRLVPGDDQVSFTAHIFSDFRAAQWGRRVHEYSYDFDHSLAVIHASFARTFRAFLDQTRAEGLHHLTLTDEIELGDYQLVGGGSPAFSASATH